MGRLADRQCYPVSVAHAGHGSTHTPSWKPQYASKSPLARSAVASTPYTAAPGEVVLRMGAVAERDSPWGATCTVPHVLTRSARTDES